MAETITTREDICTALDEEVKELVKWASGLTEESFFRSENGKWSTGEQIEHLRKSSKPLVLAFRLPKIAIRGIVGKANRPSRTFKEVSEKYQLKLGNAKIPTNRYYPELDQKKSSTDVLNAYLSTSKKLIQLISKWHEEDLDKYILPHPLLGKLTVREMMYFTIYHTRHHFDSIKLLYS